MEEQKTTKQKRTAKPKTAKVDKPIETKEDTKVNQEPKQSNDALFHMPFIAVLIVLGVGFTQLVNSSLNAGKTEQQLQKVETQFNGYKEGVKDSR